MEYPASSLIHLPNSPWGSMALASVILRPISTMVFRALAVSPRISAAKISSVLSSAETPLCSIRLPPDIRSLRSASSPRKG